jgi:Family of unknown function (DUF6064)
MNLPFSHEAFLDVFGAYNSLLWPAVVLLWIITAALVWRWVHKGRITGRQIFALLAVHWAWSGVVYHWFFFRRINAAAGVFAVLFVMQAIIFTCLAATSRAHFDVRMRLRDVLGVALVCYGLVYPLVVLAVGFRYPRMPLFGVPCPTTLVTAGFLLTSVGIPRFVKLVPALWAIIGSSAAIVLDIQPDFALVAVVVLLGLDMVMPSFLGNGAAA